MIRIAFIISRIEQLGPVKVVESLVNKLKEYNDLDISVYYLDKEIDPDIKLKVTTEQYNSKMHNLNNFDIIHTHGFRPDLIAALNRNKIKYHISTVHNLVFDDLKYTYYNIIAWFIGILWIQILKRSGKLVCVSESVKEYYKRWIPSERLITIYNGLPEQDNSQVPDKDIITRVNTFHSSGLKVIGTASVLIKRKGISQVLKIISEKENYAFIIIGEGKELKKLTKESEYFGITDRCYFTGFRSNANIYFKHFDVFVMPSYSEGFCLVLPEAVQAKVPVVCSDIPVFRELYNPKEVTFFKPNDPDSLAAAVKESLITGNDKVDCAYERYKNNYTDHLMAQRYHGLYNSL